MTTRLEDRFGELTALGTTYTIVGAAVPASTTWNVLLHVANRLTTTVKLRAYIADTSWSSGEPTSGALKAAIAYDLPISGSDVKQISGIIMKTTEKLVVRADTGSALDITAQGVAIT